MSTGFKKPKVSEVKWEVLLNTDTVKAEGVAEGEHAGFFYRVTPKGGRARTFYGESAWSDSRRLASDLDSSAYYAYWG